MVLCFYKLEEIIGEPLIGKPNYVLYISITKKMAPPYYPVTEPNLNKTKIQAVITVEPAVQQFMHESEAFASLF